MKDYKGPLIVVVGNSGSGKDSIISGAIKEYPSDLKSVHLTKRYITRPASEFEDNFGITEEQFKEMASQGEFALEWHIYGLDYGVPTDIDDWLEKGHPVIVNISRTVIGKVREAYKNVKVVFVEVPFEITLERIKKRARESGVLLEQRLERAKTHQTLPEADFIIDNSGKLEDAINQFLEYLMKLVKD